MIKITIGAVEIEFKDYDDFKKFVSEFEHLLKAKEINYIPYHLPPNPWPPCRITCESDIKPYTTISIYSDNGENGSA